MEKLWDWLIDDWFGVASALAGLWLSWRLRPHPSATVRIRGFSPHAYSQQTFTATIKNSGPERLTADTFNQPITIAVDADILTANAVRASNRGISATTKRISREAIQIAPTLEPNDWVDIELRVGPISSPGWFSLRPKITVNADLKGNRSGLAVRSTLSTFANFGVIVPGFAGTLMVILAVHSFVSDPPLGYTFPTIFSIAITLSTILPAGSFGAYSYESYVNTYERLSKNQASPSTVKRKSKAEFEIHRMQTALTLGLLASAVWFIVGAIYVGVLAFSGEFLALPWSSILLWAAAVSILKFGTTHVWKKIRAKTTGKTMLLHSAVLLACETAVALTALGYASATAALVALGILALARPLINFKSRERGVSLV